MDRYLVISADGHAGPRQTSNRADLDERFRREFDEHLSSLAELRELQRAARDNEEFRKSWEDETGGDGGLTAAYDSDVRNLRRRPGDAGDLHHRGVLVGGTAAVGAAPVGRVRAAPRAPVRVCRETGRGGRPTSSTSRTRSGSAATTRPSSATSSAST